MKPALCEADGGGFSGADFAGNQGDAADGQRVMKTCGSRRKLRGFHDVLEGQICRERLFGKAEKGAVSVHDIIL